REQGQAVACAVAGLPGLVARALELEPEVKALAQSCADARNFLYLGRGVSFPVALEGALKLKENSYIHAEGYPAAEMKPGPLALIDRDMHVCVVSPQADEYVSVRANVQVSDACG